MPAYSQLDEERDQIAFMRAAGRSICALAGGPVKVRYSWGGVTRAVARMASPGLGMVVLVGRATTMRRASVTDGLAVHAQLLLDNAR